MRRKFELLLSQFEVCRRWSRVASLWRLQNHVPIKIIVSQPDSHTPPLQAVTDAAAAPEDRGTRRVPLPAWELKRCCPPTPASPSVASEEQRARPRKHASAASLLPQHCSIGCCGIGKKPTAQLSRFSTSLHVETNGDPAQEGPSRQRPRRGQRELF